MNRRCLTLVLVIILLASNSFAEMEFGVNGLVGRSDNNYLNNPNGWSMFFSKSLSDKISIRATYERFDKDIRYLGELVFGLAPPYSAIQELIQSKASANMYEIGLHYILAESNRMRLEAGTGFGGTSFKLDLDGETTGLRWLINQSPANFNLSLAAVMTEILYPNLNVRVGYQFRKTWGGTTATDSFEPFHDVTISGLTIGLSASW